MRIIHFLSFIHRAIFPNIVIIITIFLSLVLVSPRLKKKKSFQTRIELLGKLKKKEKKNTEERRARR